MHPLPSELAARLRAWFAAGHRDLPWRRTRDPYAIWVSEIMLQQTRVETVIPYFERFLARFPTVRVLAAASEDEVLALWSGLGYYSRGRNLHRAARMITKSHGGVVPASEDALRALPGIGRYTAGAIRSIAFGERAPILDGNVTRVLSRIYALAGDPKSPPLSARLWSLAEALAQDSSPGDVNQALMELGATVCTPVRPRCAVCPARDLCGALRGGAVERFPEIPARRAPRRVNATAALVVRAERSEVLMMKRSRRGLLGGLWDLPHAEHAASESVENAVKLIGASLGITLSPTDRIARLTHVFTHRRLELRIVECEVARTKKRASGTVIAAKWIKVSKLSTLPISRLALRALERGAVLSHAHEGLNAARPHSARTTPRRNS
jgi:A/G-specific adenine glycosylase